MLRPPKNPRSNPPPPALAATPANPPSRLLPLGALAVGFGLFNVAALAQTSPAAQAAAASAPKSEAMLPAIPVKAKVETDANSVRATTSTIGKGNQELRDIAQSVTVIAERLMDDRRIDTLKEALHQTAGVTFLATEGPGACTRRSSSATATRPTRSATTSTTPCASSPERSASACAPTSAARCS